MPVLVGVLALAFITYMFRETSPNFVDLHDLHEGAMTEAQRQTVTMITELNKFLVSMVTLMFGAIAFFIMHYRRQLDVLPLNLGLLVALVLLGLTYFFGFMTYSQLATELSQNALGTIPKKSRIFYYLEMEFWTFLGASLTILFIFLRALLAANRDRRAEGG